MKLSGIVAPLALAGAASAAAIPKAEIESTLSQVHSTLGGVQSLGGVLGGSSSAAELSEVTNALKSAESKLQGLSVSSKRGMTDKASDMASTGAANGITTPINTVVSTGSKTGDKLLGNLKERQLQGVQNTAVDVVDGAKDKLEGATANLQERQLPIGSLETILKGLFAKVQSGALTPEMLMGALNPSGVQSLLGGVLGGGALGHLETIIKGVFAKVQSGELTPEMILGALNPAILQSLLGGALGNLL